MKRMVLSLLSLLFATGLAMAQEGSTAVVSTKSGKVSGIIQEGTMAYLGIPYAKVERFMPPQPVKKWSGIRKCDHWGPDVGKLLCAECMDHGCKGQEAGHVLVARWRFRLWHL